MGHEHGGGGHGGGGGSSDVITEFVAGMEEVAAPSAEAVVLAINIFPVHGILGILFSLI
jgi:hypothetical protein